MKKNKKGLSLKKRRRHHRKNDGLAWAIAKIMTKRKVIIPDWFRHGDWCWDVFGKKHYCNDCWYQNGCMKEVI